MNRMHAAARSYLETVLARLRGFRRDEGGAALVEYALLIGLMAVAVIAAAGALTPSLTQAFGKVGTQLTTLK
ncbi:Flp family type IVb pilin [Phenylobacterium sp.]|uniref:Flp family type IVb pilin n=1 Tax=Phenylobacterium sp. TaxID=1871053 RepID=UPI002CBE2032|nr:Flp family type IVb pilin [Phenylobacterium sp.]HVI31056.1 Flp family type IVb pilin [Phenylobacterium sp.]